MGVPALRAGAKPKTKNIYIDFQIREFVFFQMDLWRLKVEPLVPPMVCGQENINIMANRNAYMKIKDT